MQVGPGPASIEGAGFSEKNGAGWRRSGGDRIYQVMDESMAKEASEVLEQIRRAAAGDQDAARALFSAYRDRLKRMVHLRLSRRLSGRIDDSGVIQEAYLESAPVRRRQPPTNRAFRFLETVLVMASSQVYGYDEFRVKRPRCLRADRLCPPLHR
jgi:hypothetical protein